MEVLVTLGLTTTIHQRISVHGISTLDVQDSTTDTFLFLLCDFIL